MDEKELQEFDLEDIMKEFGDPEQAEEAAAPEETVPEEPIPEETAPAEPGWEDGATIQWDTAIFDEPAEP